LVLFVAHLVGRVVSQLVTRVLAGPMSLRQSDIINLAFGLILGAVAVAAKQLREWQTRLYENSDAE